MLPRTSLLGCGLFSGCWASNSHQESSRPWGWAAVWLGDSRRSQPPVGKACRNENGSRKQLQREESRTSCDTFNSKNTSMVIKTQASSADSHHKDNPMVLTLQTPSRRGARNPTCGYSSSRLERHLFESQRDPPWGMARVCQPNISHAGPPGSARGNRASGQHPEGHMQLCGHEQCGCSSSGARFITWYFNTCLC